MTGCTLGVIVYLLLFGAADSESVESRPWPSTEQVLPTFPHKVVLHDSPGGSLSESQMRWRFVAAQGSEVEIRGPCRSACTLVMSHIPRNQLCFDPNGLLALHLARNRSETGEWSRNDAATKWLVDSYPADILAWIDARGGYLKLPYDGYWELRAPELWGMGYRRCPDGP